LVAGSSDKQGIFSSGEDFRDRITFRQREIDFRLKRVNRLVELGN
jgi:hypothetical protein